jgi:hypothetical protein
VILLHFAGRPQDWDETISSSDADTRLRTRSKIGPLGQVVPKLNIPHFFDLMTH